MPTHSFQAMELLIEKVISSAGSSSCLSPGDCMRRILEAVSSSILSHGPGILDPCEKEPTDALASLSKQQREDITVSGQHFLRLIAFRKIYEVLGMDVIVPKVGQPQKFMRKRKRSGTEGAAEAEGGAAACEKIVKTGDDTAVAMSVGDAGQSAVAGN